MKIGICFGGYCPLHRGHMDVIMRAKKENDLTYVFVCGYDDEPRATQYDIPLMKRYRIIANFLGSENVRVRPINLSDETVRVRYINDTTLNIDESMSDSNWGIWTNYAYDIIAREVPYAPNQDYTWYMAEESYVAPVKKWSPYPNVKCVLMDRSEHPISGTAIRNNPLKYWDEITIPFRPYFSHNILITGTASEGKTTLTEDIGKYFGLPYSYEKGRDNCLLKTDKEFTVKDFIYNIYEQHKYNEELICSPWNPGVFISDTDNCVTLMYAYAYSKRKDFALNEDEYDTLYDMAAAYMKTTKWDKVFLIKPRPQGIVDDGYRYMGDSDYKIRLQFYERLKTLYAEFGIEYEEIDGSYYENFLKVKDYINGLYKEGK